MNINFLWHAIFDTSGYLHRFDCQVSLCWRPHVKYQLTIKEWLNSFFKAFTVILIIMMCFCFSDPIKGLCNSCSRCSSLLSGSECNDIGHKRWGCSTVHPTTGCDHPEERPRNKESEWNPGWSGKHQSFHAGKTPDFCRIMLHLFWFQSNIS